MDYDIKSSQDKLLDVQWIIYLKNKYKVLQSKVHNVTCHCGSVFITVSTSLFPSGYLFLTQHSTTQQVGSALWTKFLSRLISHQGKWWMSSPQPPHPFTPAKRGFKWESNYCSEGVALPAVPWHQGRSAHSSKLNSDVGKGDINYYKCPVSLYGIYGTLYWLERHPPWAQNGIGGLRKCVTLVIYMQCQRLIDIQPEWSFLWALEFSF